MARITTVLFDFDGVIADTEPQYDIFSDWLAEKYKLGIADFASCARGVTFSYVLEKYFSDFTDEEKAQIVRESDEFELKMDFPLVPGIFEFIAHLKKNGYKVGLVTSSPDFKMEIALDKLNLVGVFDTEVTANRITRGKPDPMCFLLAAKDLGSLPEECLVFEDSLFGIQAATTAGMKVVGLSTSFSVEELQDKVHDVMPDFSDLPKVISYL
ncbi:MULTISPECIES: HAD family hydrolase [unclassified Dysgonomonas]|uniref:HAD family hydrolase n=1 Tax=unclassified Dysgonomonas TaxID=2630389 RepID=UPI0013EAB5E2|nr:MULTISPECIES: HAD family phosphatase [unclassified Dysgonomonas]